MCSEAQVLPRSKPTTPPMSMTPRDWILARAGTATEIGETRTTRSSIWANFLRWSKSPALAFALYKSTGPYRTEFSDVGFDFFVVGTNKILSFDELNSAEPLIKVRLYDTRAVPVICTSGCLVVFHNKQVKRSWYSHSRERAVVFSLKTVVFSLKCLLWKNGQMFVCLVKKSFGLCPHGLRKACPGLPILSWDSQVPGHVEKALRLVNKQPLLSEQGSW